MNYNKRVKYNYALLGAILVCLLVSQCAGPIYFNKDLKKNIEPVVYLVPSSYFGSFLVALDKPKETWKTIPFGTWELFDNEVNKAFRNSFKQRGIEMIQLQNQQVCEGFKTLIASDTIKNNHLQYPTLNSICGDDYDSCFQGIKPGILLVCTKFQLKRVFPDIEMSARYYIYAISDGGLLLVNVLDKEYFMKGMAIDVLMDFGNPSFKDDLRQRLYGLWSDEKESYVNICDLFVDKLVAAVARQCLGK